MNLFACIATLLCVRVLETLLHSLWQGVAIVPIVAVVARVQRSPGARQATYHAGVVALAAVPVLTFFFAGPLLPADFDSFAKMLDPSGSGEYSLWALLFSTPASGGPGLRVEAAAAFHIPNLWQYLHALPSGGWRALAPLAAAVYFMLMLLHTLRASRSLQVQAQRCTGLHPCYDPGWLEVVHDCAERNALHYEPTVFSAAAVEGVILLGSHHPSVILPSQVVEDGKLDAGARRLAQLMRAIHQHLSEWLLLEKLVEIVFFYHPAARWLLRRIRQMREAEFATDTTVVAPQEEPKAPRPAVEYHARGHHHAVRKWAAPEQAALKNAPRSTRKSPGDKPKGGSRKPEEELPPVPADTVPGETSADQRSPAAATPSLCLARSTPLSVLACVALLALAGALFVARVPVEYPPKLLRHSDQGPMPFELGKPHQVYAVAASPTHPVLAVVDRCRFEEVAGQLVARLGLNTFLLEDSVWQLSISLRDDAGNVLGENFEVVRMAAADADSDEWISADPRARERRNIDIELGEASRFSKAKTYQISWLSLNRSLARASLMEATAGR